MVVQGAVNPDEFYVYKPALMGGRKSIVKRNCGSKELKMIYGEASTTEAVQTVEVSSEEREKFSISAADAEQLARLAVEIERHYGTPMDIEWAKDGHSGEMFVVQARPETVQSHAQTGVFKSYGIKSKGRTLATGLSIGGAVVSGKVCLIRDPGEIGRFEDGAVLVTENTDPDWVPIMKRAAAVVTRKVKETVGKARGRELVPTHDME